jgi:ACS family glucarate transporter-like MFS transporter
MILALIFFATVYADRATLSVAAPFMSKELGFDPSMMGWAFSAFGWCVLSDTSPKEVLGIAGGVFNTCGNLASIITPLMIGFILSTTGSFDMAMLDPWGLSA